VAKGVSDAQSLPLLNKTVLVTRSAGQSREFSDRLHQLGATVIEMPALEIGPPSDWSALDGAIAQLTDFDWLILTSANGVNAFFERLAQVSGHDSTLPGLEKIHIAVVGKKTAHFLRQQGREPDFVPPDFVADSLVEHFPNRDQLGTQRILFPRVESGGRAVLVRSLTAQGATVIEVPAYQSQCPATIDPDVLTAIKNGSIDIVTFASSKTVRCFHTLLSQAVGSTDAVDTLLQSVCIASIGPQTSQTCEALLGRIDVEAAEYTLDGLIQAAIASL